MIFAKDALSHKISLSNSNSEEAEFQSTSLYREHLFNSFNNYTFDKLLNSLINCEGGLDTQSKLAQIMTILNLLEIISFCFDREDVSNTRDSVLSAIQTPRISCKILRYASYFQLSSRCLDIPMMHCLSCSVFDILHQIPS